MPSCLICQRPPTKRDGYDRRGRQRYTCRPCRRDFTQLSGSAFSGHCCRARGDDAVLELPGQVPRLLGDPLAGRVGGYAGKVNAPASNLEKKRT